MHLTTLSDPYNTEVYKGSIKDITSFGVEEVDSSNISGETLTTSWCNIFDIKCE